MARTSMRPGPWATSNLTKAAALVLKGTVSLMLAGRVRLHLEWDRASRDMNERVRFTSLDISRAATGDAQKIVLSHLAGNRM
jgi:hypothetical protein